MNSWFIAVTAGRWQAHSIREVQQLGFKVVAIDENPQAEGLALADFKVTASLSDVNDIVAALESMDVVFSGVASFVSDAGMRLAAILRHRFNLRGLNIRETELFLDKSLQRQALSRAGVRVPAFRLHDRLDSPRETAAAVGMPLIVKPADSSGSRGVTKISSTIDDLESAVEGAFLESQSARVLFESFMEGPEFAVETFSSCGSHSVLAISEKKKAAGTSGLVARELFTPDRPSAVLRRIGEAARSALVALGYDDGPAHTEIILMRDGSCGIVEVAARGGGFGVFDMLVPAVSGINISRLSAMQAAGQDVILGSIIERAAVLRFIMGQQGVVTGIRGINEANRIQGVRAGAIVKVGEYAGPVRSDGDRLGWVLSVGDTPAQASELANAAEDAISFEVC